MAAWWGGQLRPRLGVVAVVGVVGGPCAGASKLARAPGSVVVVVRPGRRVARTPEKPRSLVVVGLNFKRLLCESALLGLLAVALAAL